MKPISDVAQQLNRIGDVLDDVDHRHEIEARQVCCVRQIGVLRRNAAGPGCGDRASVEVDAVRLRPVQMRESLEKESRIAPDVEVTHAGERQSWNRLLQPPSDVATSCVGPLDVTTSALEVRVVEISRTIVIRGERVITGTGQRSEASASGAAIQLDLSRCDERAQVVALTCDARLRAQSSPHFVSITTPWRPTFEWSWQQRRPPSLPAGTRGDI